MNTKQNFAILLLVMMSGLARAQSIDSYAFTRIVDYPFEEAVDKVKQSLKAQEFGIQTEIDMHQVLQSKIGANIKPYKILGACNPKFAYETIQAEANIGLFLPCKVLVKQIDENTTEIVMMNPKALMKMLGNEDLMPVATEVSERFQKALDML